MPSFVAKGFEIAFLDEGEGDPILLIHGFGSNKETNWAGPGWVKLLAHAGYRAVALDNRGHGGSSKPHDPAAYSAAAMAGDAFALLDHLEIGRADVMGYSMGARIAAEVALSAPARVRSLVIAGMGIHMVRGLGREETIAAALEAASLGEVTDANARGYRAFAEQTKSDRLALAACMRAMVLKASPERLRQLGPPVLIAVGTEDETAGSARDLAALIPGAAVLDIPGRDHMRATGDRVFKEGVLAFLEARA